MKFRICEWRKLKGISQQKLADYCGVHVNTIRAWEENPTIIPIGKAFKISECFKISIDSIIFAP